MKSVIYEQLRVFQAIVRAGGISAAARQLEVSAPSVSQSLKQLERHLGLTLFHRSTRHMELTAAGTQLFQHTQPLTQALDAALDNINHLAHSPIGSLRITLPKFVYNWKLKPFYADFCRQYPSIALEISINDATIDLIDNNFDIGIRFGHKLDARMVAKPISDTIRDAIFASPEYIQRHGLPRSPADLSGQRFIQYRFHASNKLLDFALDNYDGPLPSDLSAALIVNDTYAIVDAAIAGLGIGRVLEPVVEPYLAQRLLIPILEPYWPVCPPLYLYYPQTLQKSGVVKAFVDFFMAVHH
ncbi:MAG TPA: LysR family transcriptional regulator [Cellvibrionaceae bacterium]